MKTKQLLIILFIAVVALLLGSRLLSVKQGDTSFEQQKLFSNVDWQQLSSISLLSGISEQALVENVLIEKSAGVDSSSKWRIVSMHGYDGNVSKLAKLIQALKSAEITELKTKQASHYHRLGLDLSKNNATTTSSKYPTVVR